MNVLTKADLTSYIREQTFSLGFDLVGIAKARVLSEQLPNLREWCMAGMNAGMGYLSREMEKRVNPEILLPGIRSVIVTGLNYYSENKQTEKDVPVISRYAYGTDYHEVITGKLDKLLALIRAKVPELKARVCVDSSPLLEKAWAIEAGIGWQGRHSVIINKKIGSYFLIGIILVNIDLQYESGINENLCGNCRICIDKCPTGAINENSTIDARKCISNLTIENRGPIPDKIIPVIDRRVYGCDICQEVCPWNKFARQNNHPEFELKREVSEMRREDWKNMTEEKFIQLFSGTPVERVKFERFKNNIDSVLNKY